MPIFEILVIIILILINGLFAMSELAVVSARRPRLKTMAARGVKGAKRAMALAADPGRLLSAAQTGITLVSILAGAYSGASLGDQLSVWLQGLGMSKAWAEPLGLGDASGMGAVGCVFAGKDLQAAANLFGSMAQERKPAGRYRNRRAFYRHFQSGKELRSVKQ